MKIPSSSLPPSVEMLRCWVFYHLPSGVKQTVGNYCINMPVNTGGVGFGREKYPHNYTFVLDQGLCRLCIRGYRDVMSY